MCYYIAMTDLIKPQIMRARLEEKIAWNPNYTEFHFELVEPPTINNLAGQYVMIDIPAEMAEGKEGVKRAYSMCDRPDINHGFELVVAQSGGGVGVNYLNSLNFGDEIRVLAPLGLFTLDHADPASPAITLIATGAGIAPMKAIIAQLLQIENQTQKQITLYWGMRNGEDFFWQEDLEAWANAFPNFRYTLTASQPTDDWGGGRGRVTDLLRATPPLPETDFFICGRPEMVTEVRQILTSTYGAAATKIHQEQF